MFRKLLFTAALLMFSIGRSFAIDATCDVSSEECQDFLANVPQIKAESLSSVEISCSNSGPAFFGKKTCDQLFQEVEKQVKQLLAART